MEMEKNVYQALNSTFYLLSLSQNLISPTNCSPNQWSMPPADARWTHSGTGNGHTDEDAHLCENEQNSLNGDNETCTKRPLPEAVPRDLSQQDVGILRLCKRRGRSLHRLHLHRPALRLLWFPHREKGREWLLQDIQASGLLSFRVPGDERRLVIHYVFGLHR